GGGGPGPGGPGARPPRGTAPRQPGPCSPWPTPPPSPPTTAGAPPRRSPASRTRPAPTVSRYCGHSPPTPGQTPTNAHWPATPLPVGTPPTAAPRPRRYTNSATRSWTPASGAGSPRRGPHDARSTDRTPPVTSGSWSPIRPAPRASAAGQPPPSPARLDAQARWWRPAPRPTSNAAASRLEARSALLQGLAGLASILTRAIDLRG